MKGEKQKVKGLTPNSACPDDPSVVRREDGKLRTPNLPGTTPNSGGVGIDIVEVGRIDAAVHKFGRRFLDRVFTGKELEYARGKRRQAETLAGRFAAKEAFMKAMGRRHTWREIEILQRSGRPFILFRGEEYNGVSISHERSFAVAVMVLGKEEMS